MDKQLLLLQKIKQTIMYAHIFQQLLGLWLNLLHMLVKLLLDLFTRLAIASFYVYNIIWSTFYTIQ